MTAASSAPRRFLVLPHTGRAAAKRAAAEVIGSLLEAGTIPVLAPEDVDELVAADPIAAGAEILGDDVAVSDIELAIVLGGDGTILRAAEMVRDWSIPLIGVNLGHVGFLAEVEREDLHEVVRRALARDYVVEERMTIDVRVLAPDGRTVYETWALNEATVEKSSPGKMVEVVIEIDGRPLSAFGCDGLVMATPTGSTAYAFSGGGPVVWPDVEAMLLVPLSAHALFARPLVLAPTTLLAVEVSESTPSPGILWCDGRRSTPLEPGFRIEVERGRTPVCLARLIRGEFTDRLVQKFDLPVSGWRGSTR